MLEPWQQAPPEVEEEPVVPAVSEPWQQAPPEVEEESVVPAASEPWQQATPEVEEEPVVPAASEPWQQAPPEVDEQPVAYAEPDTSIPAGAPDAEHYGSTPARVHDTEPDTPIPAEAPIAEPFPAPFPTEAPVAEPLPAEEPVAEPSPTDVPVAEPFAGELAGGGPAAGIAPEHEAAPVPELPQTEPHETVPDAAHEQRAGLDDAAVDDEQQSSQRSEAQAAAGATELVGRSAQEPLGEHAGALRRVATGAPLMVGRRSRRSPLARVAAIVALVAAIAAVVLVVKALHGETTHSKSAAEPRVIRVLIPEGKTRAQIAQIAAAAGLEGSYRVASRRSALLNPGSYGAPRGTPDLEGFLFPATYDMNPGEHASTLVAKQLAAFRENFGKADVARARSLHVTPYQLLIIASMVEREAQVPGDRPKIAAVIYNRLYAGMPLGIDASIYYAVELQKGIATYTHELTEAELHINSPYNTRTHTGLPPTPISNPGVASIEAAAHPAHDSYLYYVAGADGCGEQVFSTTQAAFEANAAAYQAAVSKNGGHPPVCKHRG